MLSVAGTAGGETDLFWRKRRSQEKLQQAEASLTEAREANREQQTKLVRAEQLKTTFDRIAEDNHVAERIMRRLMGEG